MSDVVIMAETMGPSRTRYTFASSGYYWEVDELLGETLLYAPGGAVVDGWVDENPTMRELLDRCARHGEAS